MLTPPRSRASSASRSSTAFSARRERRIFIAVSLFAIWLRSFCTETTMFDGMCVMRTAESVLFTCWPPAPDERHVSMLAALGLEDPVRVVALDREGRGLDAVLLTGARLEDLDLEAPVCGPALVHAQQDLRPVLRVGAAGVGLDRHDRVA